MSAEQKETYLEGLKKGVVFVIFDDYNHILLELRKDGKYRGLIIIPGGGVEKGEGVLTATYREIKEETGISAKNIVNIGVVQTEEKGLIHKRHIFVVFPNDYSNQTVRNLEEESVYLWASIANARKICKHPITVQALDLVEELLKRRKNG